MNRAAANDWRIVPADFDDDRVVGLLELHARTAREATGRGSAHALDPAALRTPGIETWTMWRGGTLVGVGALKHLSPEHGEIKAMHTVTAARRRGAGGAMLVHLIGCARARGMTRVSLETGSWDYFIAARALYRRHGFVDCPPFGDYVPDVNSVFLTLALPRAPSQ
jgi:putative acetyltransferase